MLISVCITDYLQPEYTKICLESLKRVSFKDMEILLHDNSTNNLGLASASNLLAKRAKGEYLFFLNNDTLVKRDIFERLLKSNYDITGCRMYDYSKRELVSAISLDRFGCPAGKTGPVFYPDGAIFLKKKVFEEMGGFDEKLFLYGEDRDLCWRTWLAGYTIGVNTDAVFYHNTRSVNPTHFNRRFHSEKNIIRSMLKNYTLRSLVKILPQYMFWSMLELGFILLTKPAAIYKSYLKAYWWNVKNFKDTLKERKKVIHRINDRDLPFSRVVGKLWVLQNMGVRWEKS